MVTSPSVSVQLVQWGKTDLTVRSLASVRRSDYDGDIELLVYDNASPGGPGAVAGMSDVALTQGDENVGFGPAHNRLAADASGDLLLILNNDTVVDPRALSRLVARVEGADPAGAVTPQYREFDGRVLEMGGYLGGGGEGWQLFRNLTPPPSLCRMPYRSTYGSAACLLVRRDEFLGYGGFDDVFAPAYYEDTDLCMKLRRDGKPVIVEPTAIVYHYEGATAGRDTSQGLKAFQTRNRSRFLQRWADDLAAFPSMNLGAALTQAMSPLTPKGQRILWLSPHLPKPDREAGHARMVAMLDALKRSGDAVALWAEHATDAERYGLMLETLGVPWFGLARAGRWGIPQPSPVISTAHDLLSRIPWDVVVISFPELAQRMIPEVRKMRPTAAIVVDDVDLHFVRHERALAAGISAPMGIDKESELATYTASDGVITASDHESAVLDSELPGLPTWPFAVSANEPVEHPDHERRHLTFLGNFDHHPNVDAVEWWVHELGPAVANRAGETIPLRVVGTRSDAFEGAWAAAGAGLVEVVGWVPDLAPEFASARVFCAPLRYGAGTKGKILAALAHGVPVVTTSIGAEGNHDVVLDALVVADDPDEMAEVLVELMSDDGAWAQRRSLAAAAGRLIWERQRAQTAEFVDWLHRRARHAMRAG